jgi:hypothetical protein
MHQQPPQYKHCTQQTAEYLLISTQLQVLEICHSREFIVAVNTFLGITPYLHQM